MNKIPQYPPEPVEFVRILVRAFYPVSYIIVTDALLRVNNWSNSHNLAKRLRIQPKELRQILTRMNYARLVRSEKRMQRVQSNDERKASRNVNTDFWYMPIPEILDVFIYRVHLISTEVEKKRSSMVAKQKYICNNCETEYDIMDIVKNSNEAGQFICDRMGVRPDRRHYPCGGLITEMDNSEEIKETERLSHMLTHELGPLRERANICAKMDIPNHPLGNASEEVWGELVPETIGANGERVDKDGVPIGDGTNDGAAGSAAAAAAAKDALDDGVIPDRPNWFKDTVDEDADADWDTEQDKMLNTNTGTAASLNDDDNYYEQYLRSITGLKSTEDAKEEDAAATKPVSAEDTPTAPPQEQPSAAPEPTAATEEPAAADEAENVLVMVGGKEVKFSEVTDEMQEKMTDDEYKEYAAIAQRIGGGDDDMDDEFE